MCRCGAGHYPVRLMAAPDDLPADDAADDPVDDDLPELDPATMVARSDEQVSAELDGEVVLMNTVTGDYFTMNDVASHIWSLLEEPRSVADVFAEVEAGYEMPDDADPEAELDRFLRRLVRLGIVVADPSPA